MIDEKELLGQFLIEIGVFCWHETVTVEWCVDNMFLFIKQALECAQLKTRM